MATATPQGKYHPEPEINEGIQADAHAAEKANLAAGYEPTPWECTCGAAHDRGFFGSPGVHRCLRCGSVGAHGRYMEPGEFDDYRTPPSSSTEETK